MKSKTVLAAISSVLFFFLGGCKMVPAAVNRLPGHTSELLVSCGDWQDQTDYGKYTYSDVTTQQLQDSGYFQPVTQEDIPVLAAHLEEFEGWVERSVGCDYCDLADCYDFSVELISEGDYFGLECAGCGSSSEFHSDFTMYYFDLETQTLYWMRNNI